MLYEDEMLRYVNSPTEAIAVLLQQDMLIASQSSGKPIGAYPFTMEVREHQVQVNGHHLYALCALDALAISPMFNLPTCIRSCCGVTGDRITVQQLGQTVKNVDEVSDVHVAIDWNASNVSACCAHGLCCSMIFLRDKITAQEWLVSDGDREVFSLVEAIDFSSRFFVPLRQ
jgi:alkylmercury lyase